METEVTTMFYIVLDMRDGGILYFNDASHNRNWSAYRREGTAYVWQKGAENKLKDLIKRNNVPADARIINLRTTVEEIK